MSWPARHVPLRMSGSSFRRDWSYSVLLLVAYVAVFSLWMHAPRPLVIASGLAVSAVLALLMARAWRRRYFLNPWDLLWHATVILDIAAEAIVIPLHDGRGFYLCALAFVLVVGGYHGWRISRVADLTGAATGRFAAIRWDWLHERFCASFRHGQTGRLGVGF
jgi:hypothetical protein